MSETTKPRQLWDEEDRMDYMDGWHEASDMNYRSKRDPARVVSWPDPSDINTAAMARRRPHRLTHPAHILRTLGAADRVKHREVTGK